VKIHLYAYIFGRGESTQLKTKLARCWWLTPTVIATQETEKRRNTVQNQPW
jgi:hypothetical protein